jgi:hypothetical protein
MPKDRSKLFKNTIPKRIPKEAPKPKLRLMYIQALEKTQLIQLPRVELEKLYIEIPEISNFSVLKYKVLMLRYNSE